MKDWKGWVIKHKLYLVIGIILIIGFLIVITKAWLFFNFLIGNDVVIKLSVNKESILLFRGEKDEIKFEAAVTTNPFCSASCKSEFMDISKGEIIEKDEFMLKPTNPVSKSFTLKAEKYWEGVELYRFSMACASRKTFLCHTEEKPTFRNILIAMRYKPSKIEEDLKEKTEAEFGSFIESFNEQKSGLQNFEKNNELLSGIIQKRDTTEFEKMLDSIQLPEMKTTWEEGDFLKAASYIEGIKTRLSEGRDGIEKLNKSLNSEIIEYNELVFSLYSLKEEVLRLADFNFVNSTLQNRINASILEFNSLVSGFSDYNRKSLLEGFSANLSLLYTEINKQEVKESLNQLIERDIFLDLLCAVNNTCIKEVTIQERAVQTEFDIGSACERNFIPLDIINHDILNNDILNITYPKWFENDIINELSLREEGIIQGYLSRIPRAENTEQIKYYLSNREKMFFPVPSLNKTNGSFNRSRALLGELIQKKPYCNYLNLSYGDVKIIEIPKIKLINNESFESGIKLIEKKPECCVFSICRECCSDCENTPVLFLHGHAFSKDVSAEYSLDAFNVIQKRLEDDGFLNAGAISLYTERDTPKIWGEIPAQITIKGSYYLDIFREPENYVVVQTKSENIDTYAVRLKELLDTLEFKTDKDRVIIIAHSMGGLVVRRYLQIFGDGKIEKLIMIGTPNNGIGGDTADYCPVLGEKLECRDMNEGSLFLNKLNYAKDPAIEVHNIIGKGCDMKGEDGDGIVTVNSAELTFAQNHYISGSCDKIDVLHTEMLDVSKYPAVYEVIKEVVS